MDHNKKLKNRGGVLIVKYTPPLFFNFLDDNIIPMINRIKHAFDSFALSATLFLLAVVAFNIIARQLHDLTSGNISFMIPGAIELSKYTLLLIVFAALPRASTHGMINVDLLSNSFPTSIRQFLNKLWLILMALFSSILVWLFFNKALLLFARGDATQDLQMPLFYFYTLICIASLATTLSCLFEVINDKSRS